MREGIAELEQVPVHVREEFSQRRRRILERARQLEAAGVAVGRAGRERIVFDTREPKRQVIEADWRAETRSRAAEHGLGREELERLGRLPRRPRRDTIAETELAQRFYSSEGLTGTQNTFAARDLVTATADAHQDGVPAKELLALAGRLVDRPEVVGLSSGLGERYTTRELLRAEERIVRHAEEGQGRHAAVLEHRQVSATLETLPYRLADAQAIAVAGIATSGNRIDVVEALAGTGKTTCAGALREVYERAGYRVLGAAPTARAARELAERAGVRNARTLDG